MDCWRCNVDRTCRDPPTRRVVQLGRVREIHLVARDMTYYLDGQNDPNPTLHISRGEHVRIRLSNRDPGMSHDFGSAHGKKGPA